MTIMHEANAPIPSMRESIRAWLKEMRTTVPPKSEPPIDVWAIDPLAASMAVRLGQEIRLMVDKM